MKNYNIETGLMVMAGLLVIGAGVCGFLITYFIIM